MNLKPSRYNHFFPLEEEGRYLAYNALKNGLAVIDRSLYDSLHSTRAGAVPAVATGVLEELTRGGFLVRDDLDEVQVVSVQRRLAQYGGHALGYTIVPTVACNMACVYCYESPVAGVMDERVRARIVEMVKAQAGQGLKELSINWFGGEPLLCLDTLETLSRDLMAVCDEHKAVFKPSVVTNGVLYTREAALRLRELRVGFVQITLDGDRETHDRRRPMRNGRGTFDTILENLEETCGIIPIALRINIDVHNAERALAFYDELTRQPWWRGDSIFPYYGQVRSETNSCRCKEEECLKDGDFYRLQMELEKHMVSRGNHTYSYPSPATGCGATNAQGYVIGPQGELYKCWNDVGNPKRVVGSIFEPAQWHPLHVQFLTESFEDDPECRDCAVLPICLGGCVDRRIRLRESGSGAKNCVGYKYYLEESLRSFYTQHLNRPPMPAQSPQAP